jgi:hypothetical protein
MLKNEQLKYKKMKVGMTKTWRQNENIQNGKRTEKEVLRLTKRRQGMPLTPDIRSTPAWGQRPAQERGLALTTPAAPPCRRVKRVKLRKRKPPSAWVLNPRGKGAFNQPPIGWAARMSELHLNHGPSQGVRIVNMPTSPGKSL